MNGCSLPRFLPHTMLPLFLQLLVNVCLYPGTLVSWLISVFTVCVCSQCSVTCGQGKTTRQVLCVNFSDQEVNANECDPDDRPTTEQDCAMSQCPSRSSDSRPFPSPPNSSARNNLPRSQSHQWRTGPWGAVSYTTHSSVTSLVSKLFLWDLTFDIFRSIMCNQTSNSNNRCLENS